MLYLSLFYRVMTPASEVRLPRAPEFYASSLGPTKKPGPWRFIVRYCRLLMQPEDRLSRHGGGAAHVSIRKEECMSIETTVSPEYFRTRETARYMGVSEAWLAAARSRGTGPAYTKLHRGVRYSREDLEKFMKERRIASTAEGRRTDG